MITKLFDFKTNEEIDISNLGQYGFVRNKVEYKCDNCGKICYNSYYDLKRKDRLKIQFCRSCTITLNDVINKRRETCIKKYGKDNPSKIEKFKEKRKESIVRTAENQRTNFNFIKSEFLKKGYVIISENYINNKTPIEYICNKGHKVSITWNSWLRGCGCYICNDHVSKAELEIGDFLEQFVLIERNNRKLIPPLELDIVIPSKKIAIEYCGLYWHSDKEEYYHLNKFLECEKIGYQLITIFEDEWRNKKEIVKSKLKSILNISDSKIIYARNCNIREIDSKTKNKFLDDNHLQGSDKSTVKLGAFYNNILVSVMTFSFGNIAKGNNTENTVYELNRFASDYRFHVVGIASKFVSFFVKYYKPKKIFSFADRRWSLGNLYKKIGFNFIYFTKPNYWYVDTKVGCKDRIHRFNFRKSVLHKKLDNFDVNLSERENMEKNGFKRIWDCGTIKYELELKGLY